MSYCDDTKLGTRWQMSLRRCTRFYKFYEIPPRQELFVTI